MTDAPSTDPWEALRAMNALVVEAQKITTAVLQGQPGGLSDKAGLSDLIGLFDGPQQRAAQDLARLTLAAHDAAVQGKEAGKRAKAIWNDARRQGKPGGGTAEENEAHAWAAVETALASAVLEGCKCLCAPEVIERVNAGGSCGMGGCPYGGDL